MAQYFQECELIDSVLQEFNSDLKNKFDAYFNHVNRVFLFCKLLNDDASNLEKYVIASVFHDLGIWTNNTFDYINPSVALAKKYLLKTDKEEWVKEISLMIEMHHKLSEYSGEYKDTVETFRQADLIDLSLGLIRFGLKQNDISQIKASYKNAGFHFFLLQESSKRIITHPLNPLPMFRR